MNDEVAEWADKLKAMFALTRISIVTRAPVYSHVVHERKLCSPFELYKLEHGKIYALFATMRTDLSNDLPRDLPATMFRVENRPKLSNTSRTNRNIRLGPIILREELAPAPIGVCIEDGVLCLDNFRRYSFVTELPVIFQVWEVLYNQATVCVLRSHPDASSAPS